jgi:hypothetical protein
MKRFKSVLVRYGIERFLYRLSVSEYKDQFLLKGAALFSLWFDAPHRPTKDLDLLGFGPNDIPALEETIKSICRIKTEEDGLEFPADTVHGERIRRRSLPGCASEVYRTPGTSEGAPSSRYRFRGRGHTEAGDSEVPDPFGFPSP